MARFDTYPRATPADTDLVTFAQVGEGGRVRTATVAELASLAGPSELWRWNRANASQFGAPVDALAGSGSVAVELGGTPHPLFGVDPATPLLRLNATAWSSAKGLTYFPITGVSLSAPFRARIRVVGGINTSLGVGIGALAASGDLLSAFIFDDRGFISAIADGSYAFSIVTNIGSSSQNRWLPPVGAPAVIKLDYLRLPEADSQFVMRYNIAAENVNAGSVNNTAATDFGASDFSTVTPALVFSSFSGGDQTGEIVMSDLAITTIPEDEL